MKPVTHYTKSGRINIAYQVIGSGPVDIVYIPGWVSNIDWMWSCPELVNFLQELGKIARVILFDKRGTGLSDRIMELSTLEERMDDIRAVMDAAGSEKAILFGHSEGGPASLLFAATYPNRVLSLIAFGIFAKRRYSPDYPWAPTDKDRQQVYDMIENNWGSGEMDLESLAPSKAGDKVFMDWLASYFRSGASPSAALVLTKMNTQVDVINILPAVKVPTLILQRKKDIDVKIEEGRFIAERISNAEFVELDGSDHLFWVGNTREVLERIKAFVLKEGPVKNYKEQLYTIVAARVAAPERIKPGLKSIIQESVARFRGKLLDYRDDCFVSVFEGPSKAVHCSLSLMKSLQEKHTRVSFGIHIKEVAINEVHFLNEGTNRFMNAMLDLAEPGQILVSQTVKYLLLGAGLKISACKSVFESSSGAPIQLFQVSDPAADDPITQLPSRPSHNSGNSFLENVLQCIDANLGNEQFGVEVLCREIGISERQLQRKLKAITNKSPNQLISSVRLHRAKELILTNEQNISEVAYQTGFSSPAYFAKSFKKEFGISPSSLLQPQL